MSDREVWIQAAAILAEHGEHTPDYIVDQMVAAIGDPVAVKNWHAFPLQSMLLKARGHLLQIADLGIRFGWSQMSHNPGEGGRHTLALADLVILLRTLPEHDERPALGAMMPEAPQS
ncbi:hypothetical protein [Sphingomonas sp. FUKUSWIS1]|uniref:hypothetical protein n=1 Tax=Sphingomonas sp. FUKUSWIS1 TaxID=1379701 RepID=UPI00136469E1|nr:hypothetical protein [Sphingomonas sp. FUKUSWIS1]